MVEKIRSLGDDFLVGLCDAGNRQFESLLADFLGDPQNSLIEQLDGVAAFGPVHDSLAYEVLQRAQKRELLGRRTRRR
jgi:hypothetical protein